MADYAPQQLEKWQQKWTSGRRLTAVRASTGDVAWQIPLGVTEALPPGKQQTGRPAQAGAIVTGSGLVFVASTDDHRSRALDAQTGRELWVDRLERRGNADPIPYRAPDGADQLPNFM